MQRDKILGIIGGVGPLATVYFTEMLVRKTDAGADQEHINTICFNHAAIPDRTAYILDNTKPNPGPVMVEDAVLLERAGADILAIPCNTAHHFYKDIQGSVSIPVINMVEEAVKVARSRFGAGAGIGIMATNGTIVADVYGKMCAQYGMKYVKPDEDGQKNVMKIIYEQVKAGNPVDYGLFMDIIEDMLHSGCSCVITGCTELSIICSDLKLNRDDIIDSLDVLSDVCIESCGRRIRKKD